jgi:hypothetical protein
MGFNIPEGAHLVDALGGCITLNGGWDSTPFVSLKNAHKAWLVLEITNATGFAFVLTPLKSAVVAGTSPVGLTATTEVVPIWSNMDTAASDRLIKQTSAIAYTCTASAKKQMVVFQIDPGNLGLLAGVPYDCVGLRVGAGGGATDFISGLWVLEYRNAGPVVSQPTAVVD